MYVFYNFIASSFKCPCVENRKVTSKGGMSQRQIAFCLWWTHSFFLCLSVVVNFCRESSVICDTLHNFAMERIRRSGSDEHAPKRCLKMHVLPSVVHECWSGAQTKISQHIWRSIFLPKWNPSSRHISSVKTAFLILKTLLGSEGSPLGWPQPLRFGAEKYVPILFAFHLEIWTTSFGWKHNKGQGTPLLLVSVHVFPPLLLGEKNAKWNLRFPI